MSWCIKSALVQDSACHQIAAQRQQSASLASMCWTQLSSAQCCGTQQQIACLKCNVIPFASISKLSIKETQTRYQRSSYSTHKPDTKHKQVGRSGSVMQIMNHLQETRTCPAQVSQEGERAHEQPQHWVDSGACPGPAGDHGRAQGRTPAGSCARLCRWAA